MDPMKAVMMVKANEAQYAGDQLIDMSEKQQANLDATKKLRNLQEVFDSFSSDGVIDQDEASQLYSLAGDVDIELDPGTTNAGNIVRDGQWGEDEYLYTESNTEAGVDEVEAANGMKWLDDQTKKIDNAISDREDDQAQNGIELQLNVQNFTDAAGEQSSMSKQLSDLRNKISGKLDG